jgi:hypothetical protein
MARESHYGSGMNTTTKSTATETATFTRTDDDGSSEILTIVRLDGCEDYLVQVTSGPDEGDDFVGLYDLDGDQYPLSNCVTWDLATDVPADVIAAVEEGWATGQNTVERN